MVHLVDEGSEFEADLPTIWKFLQSQEDHGSSHSDHRNPQAEPMGETMTRVSWDQDVDGKQVKVVSRVTAFPPVGIAIEVVEGPMAGSKFFNFYTPKGAKTGVTIVGDFQSPMIPATHLEEAARKNFAHVFEQDSAAIKKFKAKK